PPSPAIPTYGELSWYNSIPRAKVQKQVFLSVLRAGPKPATVPRGFCTPIRRRKLLFHDNGTSRARGAPSQCGCRALGRLGKPTRFVYSPMPPRKRIWKKRNATNGMKGDQSKGNETDPSHPCWPACSAALAFDLMLSMAANMPQN